MNRLFIFLLGALCWGAAKADITVYYQYATQVYIHYWGTSQGGSDWGNLPAMTPVPGKADLWQYTFSSAPSGIIFLKGGPQGQDSNKLGGTVDTNIADGAVFGNNGTYIGQYDVLYPAPPETLYVIGAFNGCNWSLTSAPQMTRTEVEADGATDVVFTYQGVTNRTNDANIGNFRFLRSIAPAQGNWYDASNCVGAPSANYTVNPPATAPAENATQNNYVVPNPPRALSLELNFSAMTLTVKDISYSYVVRTVGSDGSQVDLPMTQQSDGTWKLEGSPQDTLVTDFNIVAVGYDGTFPDRVYGNNNNGRLTLAGANGYNMAQNTAGLKFAQYVYSVTSPQVTFDPSTLNLHVGGTPYASTLYMCGLHSWRDVADGSTVDNFIPANRFLFKDGDLDQFYLENYNINLNATDPEAGFKIANEAWSTGAVSYDEWASNDATINDVITPQNLTREVFIYTRGGNPKYNIKINLRGLARIDFWRDPSTNKWYIGFSPMNPDDEFQDSDQQIGTSLDGPQAQEGDGPARYYNLQGQPLSAPAQGTPYIEVRHGQKARLRR